MLSTTCSLLSECTQFFMCWMFCGTEDAAVEEGIAIEVPQMQSAAEATQPPGQATGDDIAIEVPQIPSAAEAGPPTPSDQAAGDEMAIEMHHGPSPAEAGSSLHPSDQAILDTQLLDQEEDTEAEEEVKEASEEEEEKDEDEEEEEEEEKDEDADDGDGDEDDDEKDVRAKIPAKDEPDDQTGLLPEYMIAESRPDLPTVDG